jgi:hypothetical protein
MTTDEFNEKYKDYLETGHYGLDIGIPKVIEYLDEKFQELIKIPGFKYSQIKLKFDYARFYAEPKEVPTSEVEKNINVLVQRRLLKQPVNVK